MSTDDARREILRAWLRKEERSASWVARRTGYTAAYIGNVLNGTFPFTDNLARACIRSLGIDFGSVGPEQESEIQPAGLAMVVA